MKRETHSVIIDGCGQTLFLLVEGDAAVVLAIDKSISARRKQFLVSKRH